MFENSYIFYCVITVVSVTTDIIVLPNRCLTTLFFIPVVPTADLGIKNVYNIRNQHSNA